MCYNSSMQDVLTPFCNLVLPACKNIFLGGTMSKSDYDYVVEAMKEYHSKDDEKRCYIINYDAIAEGLYIATRSERWPVSSELREQFKKSYKQYVSNRLEEINEPLVIIMFQGRYNRIIPRNLPRNGMHYVEDNLRQVLDSLPKLKAGEKYIFPALKIIRAEDGSDAFILPI